MATQRELVGRWSALGYRTGMASATIIPPPPVSFRRVYHMMQDKWALAAVDDQRLKVSRFEDLNDPFELLAMQRHTQASRTAFSASQGLLSFSTDWSNAVMWSHYADKHKGICLGFDVRRSQLQQVRYEDSRLRIALDDSADPASLSSELQRQLTCTKAKAWSYEEELRRFIDLRSAVFEPPRHFIPFDDDMRLAEAILGDRCTQNLEAVRTRLEGKCPLALAFKARLAYRSFRVVLNGCTRPPGSPVR